MFIIQRRILLWSCPYENTFYGVNIYYYTRLKCEPGQTNIWDCYRELAEGCDHNQDVLIECVMIDYDKP